MLSFALITESVKTNAFAYSFANSAEFADISSATRLISAFDELLFMLFKVLASSDLYETSS